MTMRQLFIIVDLEDLGHHLPKCYHLRLTNLLPHLANSIGCIFQMKMNAIFMALLGGWYFLFGLEHLIFLVEFYTAIFEELLENEKLAL